MTDPITHPEQPLDVAADLGAQARDAAIAGGTNLAGQLRSRVVREARRETWFVVNEGDDDLATLPIDLRADAALRRVEVNGEATEFSASETQVLVRPRRALRAGAGTIIVLHFR